MTDPSEPAGRGPQGPDQPFEPMPSAPALNEQELAPAAPAERPKSVENAFLLWMIGAGISVLSLIFIFTLDSDSIDEAARTGLEGQNRPFTQQDLENAANLIKGIAVVFSLIFVGLFVLFAYKMRAGRNWARITLTVLGGLSIVSTLTGLSSTSGAHLVVSFVQMILVLVTVYFMFRPDANQFFAASKIRR